MTLAADGSRLTSVREGRYADAGAALAWLVGAAATAAHPAGLAVAGLLLGIVAPSPARALASAASFGIVVAAAITTWIAVVGTWPVSVGTWAASAGLRPTTSIVADPLLAVVLALLVPPIVATPIRALA